jgi:hypothetical protein
MLVTNPPFPACKTLQEQIKTKNKGSKIKWSLGRIATILRMRYNRQRVRIAPGHTEPVNEEFFKKAVAGEVFIPDTLRSQIANILELTERETFPEYMIECKTLRGKREDKGWNQGDLARRIEGRKIRAAEISAFECGSRYCHEGTRAAIAAAFGESASEVFPEYEEFN